MPKSKHHKKNISASQWQKWSNRRKYTTMLWMKKQREENMENK
tara:strand:+ start:370 stop:498 length:129 start_codon:yes stop_codon:yes gene_type:complete